MRRLYKFTNYDAQASIELAKLSSHIFQHGDTLKKPHAFNTDDLIRHLKIMQCSETLQLKTGQRCDLPKTNKSHHASINVPEDSNLADTITPNNQHQSHWINHNYPSRQQFFYQLHSCTQV